MIPPRLCSVCNGIRTAHGVVAGSSSCPFCLAVYQNTPGFQPVVAGGASSTTTTNVGTPLASPAAMSVPIVAPSLPGVSRASAAADSTNKAAAAQPPTGIVNLSPNDVLLGRGRFASNRTGNRYYRQLLEQHCTAYAKCQTLSAKTKFTMGIVQQVKQSGRFLKQVAGMEDVFEEMPDARARVKVGQDLRYQQGQKRGTHQRRASKKKKLASASKSGHPVSECSESESSVNPLDGTIRAAYSDHEQSSTRASITHADTLPGEGAMNLASTGVPTSFVFPTTDSSNFDTEKVLRSLNSEFTPDAAADDEQQGEESAAVNTSNDSRAKMATQSFLPGTLEGDFSGFGHL